MGCLTLTQADLLSGEMENSHSNRDIQAGKEFFSCREPQTDQFLFYDVKGFRAIDPALDP